MDAVTLIFIMATGFVALTIILPLLFWFTQDASVGRVVPNSPARSPSYQVKSTPANLTPRTQDLVGAATRTDSSFVYQVKALPGIAYPRRPASRRLAVAS